MQANRSGDVATPVRDTDTHYGAIRVEKGEPLHFSPGGRLWPRTIHLSVATGETSRVRFIFDAADVVKLARELLACELDTFVLTLEAETRGQGSAGVYAHVPVAMNRPAYRAFAREVLRVAGE